MTKWHESALKKIQEKLEKDEAKLLTSPPLTLRQYIKYTCKCGKEGCKTWTYINKYGAFCYDCTLKKGLEKKVKTTREHYGVDHVSQDSEVQESIILTNRQRYGVDRPSQNIDVKNRIVKTNTERYGGPSSMCDPSIISKAQTTNIVRYGGPNPMCNQDVVNKIFKTIFNRYGVTNPSQISGHYQKFQETCLKKWGFLNPSQVPEIQQKKQDTSMQKYGVPWPMQNAEVANKSLQNSFQKKEFKCPNGRIIVCQGYEPFALNVLITDGVDENDISNDKPEIWYTTSDGKKHRYYTDIFIPCLKLCIEVKSTWTFGNDRENTLLKQKATRDAGYNHVIWIFNPKGELLETVT
jgi:hypothetical protein